MKEGKDETGCDDGLATKSANSEEMGLVRPITISNFQNVRHNGTQGLISNLTGPSRILKTEVSNSTSCLINHTTSSTNMSCGDAGDVTATGNGEEEQKMMPRESISHVAACFSADPTGKRQVRRVERGTCQRCHEAKTLFVIRTVTYCA